MCFSLALLTQRFNINVMHNCTGSVHLGCVSRVSVGGIRSQQSIYFPYQTIKRCASHCKHKWAPTTLGSLVQQNAKLSMSRYSDAHRHNNIIPLQRYFKENLDSTSTCIKRTDEVRRMKYFGLFTVTRSRKLTCSLFACILLFSDSLSHKHTITRTDTREAFTAVCFHWTKWGLSAFLALRGQRSYVRTAHLF